MIILSSTSDLLQVTCAASIGTGGVIIHASWVDYNGGVVTPGRTDTTANTGTTTFVSSPAVGTQRNVKTIHMQNNNQVTVNVIITHVGNVTSTLYTFNLENGGAYAEYVEGLGWQIYSGSARASNPKSFNPVEIGYAWGSTTYITTVGASTYSIPANTRAIYVTCVGGGAGGGGAASAASSASTAGGGGAGGTSQVLIINPVPSYSVTVGGGGNGGTAGANNGTGGTDTTFSTLCTGKGGSGGNGATAGTAVAVNAGGAGGAASSGVGDIKYDGGGGFIGVRLSGSVGVSGAGGTSVIPNYGGGGGGIGLRSGTGNNGGNYGGGGGGAGTTFGSTASAGGNGAQGVIIVEEYY